LKHSTIILLCILIGLLLTACAGGENPPPTANTNIKVAPLSDTAYKAAITPVSPPATLHAGEQASLHVKVKNIGDGPWPAQGQGPKYKVDLGNHWFDKKGVTEVLGDDGRVGLPHDLKPGEEVELVLPVKAPKTPGDYTIVLDMVHEDLTWFALRGSQTAKINVTVQ